MNSAALSLFRRALRAARRCPDVGQAATWHIYARNSFRDARGAEPRRAAQLMQQAEDQISFSEYLHAARASEGAVQAPTGPRLAALDPPPPVEATSGDAVADYIAAQKLALAVRGGVDGIPRRASRAARVEALTHTDADHSSTSVERKLVQWQHTQDYCASQKLPVDVSAWDADELAGLTAEDLDALGFERVQAVRLLAKIRGLRQAEAG